MSFTPTYSKHRLSTRDMTWDRATRTLVGEASTLTRGVACRGYALPLVPAGPSAIAYRMAVDVESHKTGTVVRFVLDREHRDAEGDVTHWTFTSLPWGAPGARDITLTIFND